MAVDVRNARERHRLAETPSSGQLLTRGWPVLHAGTVPRISKESWRLKVHGEVETELSIKYSDLVQMRSSVQICDIHCITSWSKFDVSWEGIKFKDLIDIAKPTSKAHFAVFECEQGFTTNLPLEPLFDDDVMIAFKAQGQDLEGIHGGPVRLLVPKRYFYKSAKWLNGIKLTEHEQPGFGEIRGYSNSADPRYEERYAGLRYLDVVKNRIKAYGRKK